MNPDIQSARSIAEVEHELRKHNIGNIMTALELTPRNQYETRARLWKLLAEEFGAFCKAVLS